METLTASSSWQLLHQEMQRRWPVTPDELDAIVRYALLPAGKMIRPIMTLHCAAAVGGDPEPVLPAALALEYVHVATLVHDDIIDNDDVRRGRASVPAAYGVPNAIIAGDQLIFDAFAAITGSQHAGLPAGGVVAAVSALAEAGAALCRGQSLESRLAGDLSVGVEPYLEVARLKTGALFRAACQVGAALGGADPATIGALADYGEQLGIAFQIRDDLLSYTEQPDLIGKSTTSDLSNGRATLPVLLAWAASSPDGRTALTGALRDGAASQAAVTLVADAVRATTALERSYALADEYAGRAHRQLAVLAPSASTDVLAAVPGWATARRW
ncbi:polyprenyl synthetase family protein [Actinoplanes derwentensis]|uniref:Geranylgeranyl diphosphate synthase, type I n=1 Tax=Actinoplanes derwentensis TaxID=113562 RepID=A0A1H1W8A3_9ACTN|nr:polyprenyl synthetase family protein [Actinoplanes derwentensis]SDS93447.1 geranylgeranyl diphosphate synthase, type I [Actinoplanes derwentensis]